MDPWAQFHFWSQWTPGINELIYLHKIIFPFGHNGSLGSISLLVTMDPWAQSSRYAYTKEFSLLATMDPWAKSSRYAYKIIFPSGHTGPLGSIEQISLHIPFGHNGPLGSIEQICLHKRIFPYGHNGPLGSIEQICLRKRIFPFGHNEPLGSIEQI